MINPEKITDFQRTDSQLEELMLFAVLVAGKNARTQALKLDQFLGENVKHPFKFISSLILAGTLKDVMENHGLGKYNLLEKSFRYLVDNFSEGRLRTASIEELEKVPGVGMKTANFFLLHSKQNHDISILDTHILSWMQDKGIANVPKITPTNKKIYIEFSDKFKELIKLHFPTLTLPEADLTIWRQYSSKKVNDIV